METSQYPGLPQALGHGHNAGAMENNDMDIDMDIDLGPIDDSELLQQVGRPNWNTIVAKCDWYH